MAVKKTHYESILEKLDEIHFCFPDLSFGEVVQLSVDGFRKDHNNLLSDFNDKELVNILDTFLKREKDKRGGE